MTLLIREAHVDELLTMPKAVELVEEAFRALAAGTAENKPRQRVKTTKGVLHVMPAALTPRYVGFKAYTSFRGQNRFHVHLFDGDSGDYLAIIEANRLGQMRTGAASGVATRYLARADSHTVGIIGSGWQAESQLQAMCAVREITAVSCYSRNEERRRAFSEKMSLLLAIPVNSVDDPRLAVQQKDIVITATNSTSPVLSGEWLALGTHVNAIGSNWPQKREIDDTTVTRCSAVVVDSLEQATLESGNLILSPEISPYDWSRVIELAAVVAGKEEGRRQHKDITLFKSHGIAIEDVAVAGWVYEQARERRFGEPLAL